mmetsp:Transcript_33302/g.81843  ORF Transcript_33302/g.81843 Transcript_33302/m.81843 type:complete len:474 (-) Transcript_33302:88-1509(-)
MRHGAVLVLDGGHVRHLRLHALPLHDLLVGDDPAVHRLLRHLPVAVHHHLRHQLLPRRLLGVLLRLALGLVLVQLLRDEAVALLLALRLLGHEHAEVRAVHAVRLLLAVLELVLAVLLLLRRADGLADELHVERVVALLGRRQLLLLHDVEGDELLPDDLVLLQLGAHLHLVRTLLRRPARLHLRHVLLHHLLLVVPPLADVGALLVQHPQRRLVQLLAQLHLQGIALLLLQALALVHGVELVLLRRLLHLRRLLLLHLQEARLRGGHRDGPGVARPHPIAALAPLLVQHLVRELHPLLLALLHEGTRAALQRRAPLLRRLLRRLQLVLQRRLLRVQLARQALAPRIQGGLSLGLQSVEPLLELVVGNLPVRVHLPQRVSVALVARLDVVRHALVRLLSSAKLEDAEVRRRSLGLLKHLEDACGVKRGSVVLLLSTEHLFGINREPRKQKAESGLQPNSGFCVLTEVRVVATP